MNKKFIKTIFFVALILYIIYSYFVLNYKMLYMNQEYPMWLDVKTRINSSNDINYTILMIGDSRAKAGYMPNILNKFIQSVNLSLGGATPIEGYYTLLKYLNHHKSPKKLILSYTPTHLGNDNCYWERTVYFNFLDYNEYKSIETKAKEFNATFILKKDKNLDDFKYPNVYGSSFKNGIRDMRWIKNKKIYKECKKAKGHHFFGTRDKALGLNTEAKKTKFNPSSLQDFYLKEIIKLAQDSNIETFFYVMPFNESSYKKVTLDYKTKYNNYLIKISNKYNMKLCNKIWFLSNDNFGDPSHLYRGAKFNSLKVYECLIHKNNN